MKIKFVYEDEITKIISRYDKRIQQFSRGSCPNTKTKNNQY